MIRIRCLCNISRGQWILHISKTQLDIRTGVENIFNKPCDEHLDWGNYFRPGRNIYLNLNITLLQIRNKMIRNTLIVLFLATASCSVSERPIVYGTDECDYCKMIIMDHRYGSELVTSKGKIYTFDAAECLVNFLHNNEAIASSASFLLVTPYTDPNSLFDARAASFLVSKQMPSPMGAYLTAFKDRETALEFQSTNGGNIYTWDEIYKNLKSIRQKVLDENE